MSPSSQVVRRRKLRVLILSMGGERRRVLEQVFCQLHDDFEIDFSPGIPSRELRNRESFFRHCHGAGILPMAEWHALQVAFAQPDYNGSSNTTLFDCLAHIPIAQGRRGSDHDVTLHYSVELWRKAKTLNRGRSVLACALAHLTALRRLVTEQFDVLLEDNVRLPVDSVADRMWDTIQHHGTLHDNNTDSATTGRSACHMRYFGWLGSIPNLTWIYTSHIPNYDPSSTTVPCPTPQDIEADLARTWPPSAPTLDRNGCHVVDDVQDAIEATSSTAIDIDENADDDDDDDDDIDGDDVASPAPISNKDRHSQPGGNPVWGTYAYWISEPAYHAILQTLQNDVGALLWKSKRMRHYHVKPIDKIAPRIIRATYGNASVQITTRPSFFRAPMLTSQIHTQWDPEFCKSTSYQLQQSHLNWTDLSLTAVERQIVQHAVTHDMEWLTPAEYQQRQSAVDDEESASRQPNDHNDR